MSREQTLVPRASWRLGPLSILSWSTLAYLVMVAAIAWNRLGEPLPLYSGHEYMVGSGPMLWLAYVSVPLSVRDGFLRFKGLLKHRTEFSLNIAALVVLSLAFYRYVFGWY